MLVVRYSKETFADPTRVFEVRVGVEEKNVQPLPINARSKHFIGSVKDRSGLREEDRYLTSKAVLKTLDLWKLGM